MRKLNFATWEKWLFAFLIFISLIPILSVRFVPTFDGACHLNNARVLAELFSSHSFMGDYYGVNHIPIPNWLTQFLLSLFMKIFPAFISEKIVLSLYVISLPLSFRYLVKSFSTDDNVKLTFTIFPIIFNFPFIMGFYNLCLSFSILFLVLGYWEKVRLNLNFRIAISLTCLFLLLFFAHLFSFCFALAIIGIREFVFLFQKHDLKNPTIKYMGMLKRAGYILTTLVPGFILTFIYFKYVSTANVPGEVISFDRRLQMLLEMRVLVALNDPISNIYFGIFGSMLCILLLIVVLTRIYKLFFKDSAEIGRLKFLINQNDFWLLLALFCFLLFLFVPDNWNAGMMTDRLFTLGILLFIVWLALQNFKYWLLSTATVICIVVQVLLVSANKKGMAEIGRDAKEIEQFDRYIKDGKTVAMWNRSDNWLQSHFCNYLGVNKPIILLDNFQADLKWFPTQWKTSKLNNYAIGKDTNGYCFFWKQNEKATPKPIDYIFIYYPREDECNDRLNNSLKKYYKLESSSGKCQLFSLVDSLRSD